MTKYILALFAIFAFMTLTAVAQQTCGDTDYNCKIAAQTRLIQSDPNNIEAYYNRGMAYKNSGDFAAALADFSKYLTFTNTNKEFLSDGYNERGFARYKTDDLAGALADYNKAIATNPSNGSAYFRRGLLNYDQKKYPASVADYDQSLKLDPDNYEALYNRAQAYRFMSSCDRAIADYTSYIAVNSAKLEYAADGYRGRGMCYNLTAKYDQAIADLSKAIQLDPSKPLSYTERAKAYRKLGKTALADADDAKAAELK